MRLACPYPTGRHWSEAFEFADLNQMDNKARVPIHSTFVPTRLQSTARAARHMRESTSIRIRASCISNFTSRAAVVGPLANFQLAHALNTKHQSALGEYCPVKSRSRPPVEQRTQHGGTGSENKKKTHKLLAIQL
jgi:hypothetical protein